MQTASWCCGPVRRSARGCSAATVIAAAKHRRCRHNLLRIPGPMLQANTFLTASARPLCCCCCRSWASWRPSATRASRRPARCVAARAGSNRPVWGPAQDQEDTAAGLCGSAMAGAMPAAAAATQECPRHRSRCDMRQLLQWPSSESAPVAAAGVCMPPCSLASSTSSPLTPRA